MATNMDYVIGKIKVEGVLKEVLFKTSGKLVTMENGKTAEAVIAEILTSIAALPTDSGVDTKIKTATDALYNKILGKVDEDTTIDEAYDTLKEVQEWITSHGTAAAAITSDVSDLKTAVQALQAVGATKVEASENNGYIKINGTDTKVYEAPETISADKVTETDSKQFISKADKEALQNRAQIFVSATEPTNMKNGDIWFQTVEE